MNNLLSSYLLGLWQLFIWLVMSDIAFVNPPPWYLNTDYTQNAVYIQGKTLNIAWGFTAAGNQSDEPVSVYMYQLNETNLLAMGTNEKIVDSALNVTNYQWIVDTTKNLTESNLFLLSIYQEYQCCGHTADNSSVVFNISSASAASTSSSPSSSVVSSPTASLAAGNTPTADVSTSQTHGLSTRAEVAIIACILSVGILAAGGGCFVYGRKRGRLSTSAGTAAAGGGGGVGFGQAAQPPLTETDSSARLYHSNATNPEMQTSAGLYYSHGQYQESQQQQQQAWVWPSQELEVRGQTAGQELAGGGGLVGPGSGMDGFSQGYSQEQLSRVAVHELRDGASTVRMELAAPVDGKVEG